MTSQRASQFVPEIDRLWDALTKRGMHYDRESMEHDEPALVDRHRASLSLALDEGDWVPRSVADEVREALLKLAGLVLTDHEADERGYLHYDTEYEGVIRDRASVAGRLLDQLGLERPPSPYGKANNDD